MSVVQFEASRGFGAPLHRHEHELFVVLDGELRFTYGEDTIAGPQGTIAYLPADQPIDPGHVAAVCAEYDITILGPPPGPLDEAGEVA